jgi:two-component system sensor histidine kinase KdpD
MHSRRAFRFRQIATQSAIGGAGIVAITAAGFPLHPNFALVGCFYLLLVVLQSTFVSFAASAIVSVLAVVSLDYFFVPPFLSVRIDKPIYGLGLLTFLVTSLVITRLASKAREEARNANGRRDDLARLYDLASRLVSVGPDIAVTRGYLGMFRRVFGLRAVCLVDTAGEVVSCDGEPEPDLAARTEESYVLARDFSDEQGQVAVRCLRVAEKPIGAVGFSGLQDADSTVGPLSMLAAAMIQRARASETASEAAAATQLEVLRSALLDAFAHQIKTPLTSILTAAEGLRETGPLVSEQRELVENIEAQAAGMGRLTTRLLRMARLDRNEIEPKMQSTDLSGLLRRIVHPYRFQNADRALVFEFAESPVEVLSDPDLLSLALIQLVDNAVRYSSPSSAITVTASTEEDSVLIRVTNEGSYIPVDEQHRIFDRFYRGAAANQAPGTGLGLYIARKIVLAHGGTLEFDGERRYGQNTTFCLRLPVAKDEYQHELKAS